MSKYFCKHLEWLNLRLHSWRDDCNSVMNCTINTFPLCVIMCEGCLETSNYAYEEEFGENFLFLPWRDK